MRRYFALLFVLCVPLCGFGYAEQFDWDAATVEHYAPGIWHVKQMAQSPRPMRLHVLRVDSLAPGLRFITTPRCAEWKVNKAETQREPARDFVREANTAGAPMVAAINADAFSPWPAPWNEDGLTNLAGLAIADGQVVSPPSGEPSFIVENDGDVRIEDNDAASDLSGIQTAVSGFGFCLRNGAPQKGGDDMHPRTGIGIDGNARYVILLTIDGRHRDSQGATTEELGEWLRYFGADDGINLDGGGSTTMVRWNPELPGPDKSEVLNNPVGNGVNWLDKDPALEKILGFPTERFNGNHLGVAVLPLEASASSK